MSEALEAWIMRELGLMWDNKNYVMEIPNHSYSEHLANCKHILYQMCEYHMKARDECQKAMRTVE